MKIQIQNAFNKAASTYGQAARLQAMIAKQAASLVPQKKYKRVLEIGCGNGQSSKALLRFIRHKEYFALDLAPEMLKQAQKNCPKIFYFSADGENTPLRPHSFDLLFSASCMQWYQNTEISIQDNLNLLKKNGVFSFSIFTKGTFHEIHECIKKTGYGSALKMKEKEYYIKTIEKKTHDYDFFEKKYTLLYDSFRHFTKENKKSGTFATKNKIYRNKRKMMDFIDTYNKLYIKNGKAQITYNILFIHGKITE